MPFVKCSDVLRTDLDVSQCDVVEGHASLRWAVVDDRVGQRALVPQRLVGLVLLLGADPDGVPGGFGDVDVLIQNVGDKGRLSRIARRVGLDVHTCKNRGMV